MIDDIFELIMKEARARKGPSIQTDMLMVLLEVTEKVFSTFETIKVEDIKNTRLRFTRKDP